MTDLRTAVLTTLAYYDVFDYPLTSAEVHKFLVNPARWSRRAAQSGIGTISFADIVLQLDALSRKGKICEKNGFYMLSPDRASLYDVRMERQNIASDKWKRMMRTARWFHVVPYLRGMFVSGSLSINNSSAHGDFDVLVIGEQGRLYTLRLILSLVASLLRVRRKRNDKVAPNKFCFNHYITTASMKMENENMYTAHTYAQLVPLLVHEKMSPGDFFAANTWINKYMYNFRPSNDLPFRVLSPGRFLAKCASFGERLLSGSFGARIERFAKFYQQRRLARNPETYEDDGRVIFTDDIMEFHPRTVEPEILTRYDENLKTTGVYTITRSVR